MRWKILLVLLLPIIVSSCASRKHTSSRKAEGRSAEAGRTSGGRDDHRSSERGRDRSTAVHRSLDTEEYVRMYSSIAVEEMQRSRVPASITLAQGILESGNGNSRLARQANNHFGIKCTSDWSGGKTYKDDDRRNECFRVYRSARDSYRDHSDFLKRSRYRFLFDLDPDDYKKWAYGLKKAGYATNPRYPRLLIDLIERYELYRFDRPGKRKPEKVLADNKEGSRADSRTLEPPVSAEAGVSAPDPSVSTETAGSAEPDARAPAGIISHYHYTVKKGDTLYAISKRFGISVDELKQWNSLSSNSISTGQQLRVSR